MVTAGTGAAGVAEVAESPAPPLQAARRQSAMQAQNRLAISTRISAS